MRRKDLEFKDLEFRVSVAESMKSISTNEQRCVARKTM
jgi:hypothetical protein